jgi:hypothetical protein
MHRWGIVRRAFAGVAVVATVTACSAPAVVPLSADAARVVTAALHAADGPVTPDVAVDELTLDPATPHAGAATSGSEVDPAGGSRPRWSTRRATRRSG